MSAFEWPVRVYWEDTDAGGVVYHTGYIRFFERGRTEWLRQLGFSQARMAEETGVLFSVVELTTEFIQPARLDDELIVHTRIAETGGATVTFEQQILRQPEGARIAAGRVRVACLDAKSFRPRRLPQSLRQEFK
ncbi:MAG: tol-pal system-associated acyl-CoA thioesterase [Steroidobacteraceae bacterium]